MAWCRQAKSHYLSQWWSRYMSPYGVTKPQWFNTWGPFYRHGFTLIPVWIRNRMPSEVWDEIIYPFPNFNGCTVKVWECISNFIPHFITDVITYPCWVWSYPFTDTHQGCFTGNGVMVDFPAVSEANIKNFGHYSDTMRASMTLAWYHCNGQNSLIMYFPNSCYKWLERQLYGLE